MTAKTIINIALILITLTMGVVLHKTGKPYNTLFFTVHKLATVAFAVITIKMAIAFAKSYGVEGLITILIISSVLSLLGLLASGGAMSLDKSHELMHMIHRISTAIFVISISGLLYKIA